MSSSPSPVLPVEAALTHGRLESLVDHLSGSTECTLMVPALTWSPHNSQVSGVTHRASEPQLRGHSTCGSAVLHHRFSMSPNLSSLRLRPGGAPVCSPPARVLFGPGPPVLLGFVDVSGAGRRGQESEIRSAAGPGVQLRLNRLPVPLEAPPATIVMTATARTRLVKGSTKVLPSPAWPVLMRREGGGRTASSVGQGRREAWDGGTGPPRQNNHKAVRIRGLHQALLRSPRSPPLPTQARPGPALPKVTPQRTLALSHGFSVGCG
ncbi:hypothetical protein H920_14655 [Fukomys damarensis]|uniref:Uncharacterized protein n=1 Tax=Fukomys damarensis TaxID=885580 RepID=A0A091CW80_FUKDA|nr:hypothetical protein H920_14655 [Fukomys damarensis]